MVVGQLSTPLHQDEGRKNFPELNSSLDMIQIADGGAVAKQSILVTEEKRHHLQYESTA